MKAGRKQRPIQRQILISMIAMTTAILLGVMLVFNVSIRLFVARRITAQMDEMLSGIGSHQGMPEGVPFPEGGPPPLDENGMPLPPPDGEGRPPFGHYEDRVLGIKGNLIVLDRTGAILRVMEGDEEETEAISEYFLESGSLTDAIRNKQYSLGGEEYIISTAPDPLLPDAVLVFYMNVTSITAMTTGINLVLGLVILLAIGLSVLLSRRFAKALAEPVEKLSAFAADIGAGNLEPRELTFPETEFGRLADAMNHMASDLKDANQKQETFFQNVSHELRTPLTAIQGNAEGILYGVMDPESASRVILSETDRLGSMVEDLLYLSRMGRSNPEGAFLPLDLREVMSLCVSEQHAEADRQKVAFRFDFDEEPVTAAMRDEDAHKLLGNLISNAIRYAEARVSLGCHRQGAEVVITVSDDGPGIPEEELPLIFQRFYKGRGGQHGIGLAIVRSVVDAYGGTVTAESRNGAVFTVRFPASTAEEDALPL